MGLENWHQIIVGHRQYSGTSLPHEVSSIDPSAICEKQRLDEIKNALNFLTEDEGWNYRKEGDESTSGWNEKNTVCSIFYYEGKIDWAKNIESFNLMWNNIDQNFLQIKDDKQVQWMHVPGEIVRLLWTPWVITYNDDKTFISLCRYYGLNTNLNSNCQVGFFAWKDIQKKTWYCYGNHNNQMHSALCFPKKFEDQEYDSDSTIAHEFGLLEKPFLVQERDKEAKYVLDPVTHLTPCIWKRSGDNNGVIIQDTFITNAYPKVPGMVITDQNENLFLCLGGYFFVKITGGIFI